MVALKWDRQTPAVCLFSAWAVVSMAAAMAAASETKAPDRSNPDYVYCEDFEEGTARDGSLPAFEIVKRCGVREGAGCNSRYGFSNVLIENHGIPPYPTVRFPKQDGIVFVHYHVKAPENFYLGRANHGYYLYDSEGGGRGKHGSAVMDHATDHPVWLDPEWDPHTIQVLRGSGYHRMTRSFEGFEPKPRGQWHSHQVMLIPSQKDPKVGRMKVWIDGELANFCKHDTIPSCDTFWISNYWHSWEYVPKDTLSNLFEAHTAPPHPAFEIFLDNLIVSKSFIEFGPNRFQIERVRFANFREGQFTVHFDTTVAAKSIGATWGDGGDAAGQTQAEAAAPGFFHSLPITGLKPGRQYRLQLSAVDAKGRNVQSEEFSFRTSAEQEVPDFQLPDWKGEVFANASLEGSPAYVRNFRSLSYIAWPGHDSDDLVDTSKPMSVRYTKRQHFPAGTHAFRVAAYDGVRVRVDGETRVESLRRTQGHVIRRDFALSLTEGEHEVSVEHYVHRADDWERSVAKWLAFRIEPEDKTPPRLLAQGIYNTRFHKPDSPLYAGRWSEDCAVTIDFGPDERYGQAIGDARQFTVRPRLQFPALEVGKTYHYRVTAVDVMGNKTVLPDARFTVGDTIPPCKTLIAIARPSDDALEIRFTAPGEDARHGAAAAYNLRWSTEPLHLGNWQQAKRVANLPAPQPGSSKEVLRLSGFPKGKTYYFALRAIDAAGQESLLSNVVSDPLGPEVMDCDGDGFGVGSLKGPDPDDQDPNVPGR